MKDTKSLLLLILSLLLAVVSLALLWTWGYNYGRQNNYSFFESKGNATGKFPNKDSLNQLYNKALQNLSNLDSAVSRADSFKFDIGSKLDEFYQLRDEIASLLNSPDGSAGLVSAQSKIGELQTKVDELRDQNKFIIKENKRLSALLNQLASYQKQGNSIPDSQTQTQNPISTPASNVSQPKKVKDKKESNMIFSIADISVSGVIEDDNNNVTESDQADLITRIKGNFDLNNNQSPNNTGEIVIVIQQPDGKVLKSATWETGTFETKEGKRVYSSKVGFECNKGETKKLSFSLAANQYPKGNYTIQFFQNGNLIGKTNKMLN